MFRRPEGRLPFRMVLRGGLLLLFFSLWPVFPSHASTPVIKMIEGGAKIESKETQPLSMDVESVQDRISELDNEIQRWEAIDAVEVARRYGISEENVRQRKGRLSFIQTFLKRYLTAVEKSAKLQQEMTEIEKGLSGKLQVQEKPPYSLSFYQGYLDRLENLDRQEEAVLSSLRQLITTSVATKGRINEAERNLRLLKDQGAGVSDEEVPPSLLWNHQMVLLELELARAMLQQQERQMDNLRIEEGILRERKKHLSESIAWIRENLKYDEDDLQRQISRIRGDVEALKKDIQKTAEGIERAEKSYIEAQGRVEVASGDREVALARSVLAERTVLREYLQYILEQSEEMLEYLNEMELIWNQWYGILRGDMSTDDLRKLRSLAEKRNDELQSVLLMKQRFYIGLSPRMAVLEKDLQAEGLGKDQVASLKAQIDTLNRMNRDHGEFLSTTLNAYTLNRRLLEELEASLKTVQITEKVSSLWRERMLAVWNTELWVSGGVGVTVKKVVIALVIIAITLLLSGRFVRYVGRVFLSRFKLDITAIKAIQKLLFYVLVAFFILMALKTVNIPLTAFAFLGGALAIGVGFGAQHFFSNLISGMILMIEKPFRTNDMIQIGDVYAEVKEIDSRATRVSTFDNVDIIVPNSYFLNNMITNWTLKDRVIRNKVTIGVAYGSSTRKVERLLLKVVAQHDRIRTVPQPYVIFDDFGDSSLVFDLYFWVDLKVISAFQARSDVRHAIAEIFEEEEISIAFPQQDVHLDSIGPLDLRLMSRPDRAEEGTEK